MENMSDFMAEEFVVNAEKELARRNRFLEYLNEWYLATVKTSQDRATLHLEYSARRRETIQASQRIIDNLGKTHDITVGIGKRPVLEPTIVKIPAEVPLASPPGTHHPYGQNPVDPTMLLPTGYRLVPLKSRISGRRVAAGILAVVFSLWATLVFAAATASYSFTPALGDVSLFLAMWGCFVCGIVIMAKSRSRAKGAPITLTVFTGIGFLGIITSTPYFSGLFQFMGPATSMSILILMIIDLRKSRTP